MKRARAEEHTSRRAVLRDRGARHRLPSRVMSAVASNGSLAFRVRARSRNARSSAPVAHAFSRREMTRSKSALGLRGVSFGVTEPPRSSLVDTRRDIPLGGARDIASPRFPGERGSSLVARGLPIPIIGGLFSAPVLAVMYVFVAIRFALNYNKTSFTEKNKALMIGLWPVLAVTSVSFRENLKKATMG